MKQSFEMFLHFDVSAYPEPKFVLHAYDMSSLGYIVVGKTTVECEVPDDFNPIPVQVASLRAERERISKEFGAKLMNIDDQIGKLLCLTNEVEA